MQGFSFSGTIQQQIDEAATFLSQHIPVGARVRGGSA
jgi:hypothetical protein